MFFRKGVVRARPVVTSKHLGSSLSRIKEKSMLKACRTDIIKFPGEDTAEYKNSFLLLICKLHPQFA